MAFMVDIIVDTMYIDKSVTKGKYTRYLLRESYRENGKVDATLRSQYMSQG